MVSWVTIACGIWLLVGTDCYVLNVMKLSKAPWNFEYALLLKGFDK